MPCPFLGCLRCHELSANCRPHCRFWIRIASGWGDQIAIESELPAFGETKLPGIAGRIAGSIVVFWIRITSKTKLEQAVTKIRLDQDGLSCGKDQAGRGWARLEERPGWARLGLLVTQLGWGWTQLGWGCVFKNIARCAMSNFQTATPLSSLARNFSTRDEAKQHFLGSSVFCKCRRHHDQAS